MVVQVVGDYKQKHNGSYQHTYDMSVEGNPSFYTYALCRRKLVSKTYLKILPLSLASFKIRV